MERKSERELLVTGTVNGPARLVFEAWTSPALFAQQLEELVDSLG